MRVGERVRKPIELERLSEEPLVSVLVANYNYEEFLGAALRSLSNQSYENFEAIVCDDGSTDDSVAVVEELAATDPRIRLVRQQNGGHASAMNRAFAESKGRIVAILDADDVYLSDRLERVVDRMRRAGSGICLHQVVPVDRDGNPLGDPVPQRLATGWLYDLALANGGRTAFPPASGLSFRREVATLLFPIPIEFRRAADGYLAAVSQFTSEAAAIEKPLALYRLHGANITGLFDPSLGSIENVLGDLERLHHAQVDFLRRMGDGESASRLSLMDSVTYVEHRLARALLREEDNPLPRGSLERLKPWRRRVWLALFALPRGLTVRVFAWWWGGSRSKRIMKTLRRRIRSAIRS